MERDVRSYLLISYISRELILQKVQNSGSVNEVFELGDKKRGYQMH